MRAQTIKRFALLLGTGFGSGYLKPAPGTWGSAVGFGYFALLLHAPLIDAIIIVAGVIALSIWSSKESARALGGKDPGEVVIDEIAAVPLAAWPLALLDLRPWWLWLAVFIAWRIADVVKPFPARQLESLPGGWGIVMDDLMSATYVGLAFWGLIRMGWL
jgi:phosphatidylglycerophosphatase A